MATDQRTLGVVVKLSPQAFILVVGALCLALLPSCQDKAQPSLTKCNELEAKGDLKGAVDACREAVSLGGDRPTGKEAISKMIALQFRLQNQEEEAAKKAAQAEEAACKSGKWVTFCETGGGYLKLDSKAKCEGSKRGFEKGFKIRCSPCRCGDDVPGALTSKEMAN
jgi:hypothetical protein